jgi:hypothetical protein
MSNPKPVNALKDPEHRKDVMVAVTAIVLMLFSFTACNYIMSHHYDTRFQIAFLIAGLCYMMTAIGMATDKGIVAHH